MHWPGHQRGPRENPAGDCQDASEAGGEAVSSSAGQAQPSAGISLIRSRWKQTSGGVSF